MTEWVSNASGTNCLILLPTGLDPFAWSERKCEGAASTAESAFLDDWRDTFPTLVASEVEDQHLARVDRDLENTG